MAKLEIEITDEQLEKVKKLEAQDISVGDAIDKLFEMKEKALPEIEAIDDEKIGLFEKVKENTLDIDNKADVLDENFSEADKTYEMKVKEVKYKVRWAKDFFKY